MATLTSRQRMITAMLNGRPDSVPVAPDISNMVPCRLTGKPFWDIYLYWDPPLFLAYVDAVKYFGFDGWLPDAPACFPHEQAWIDTQPTWREAIVLKKPDMIYTRQHAVIDGREVWSEVCTVYPIDNPPTPNVPLHKVGLPAGAPAEYEDVERRSAWPGLTGYRKAREMMGEAGAVGIMVTLPGLEYKPEAITDFFYHPDAVIERCEREHQAIIRRTEAIVQEKPDFVLVGMSGHMIFNPEPIFRQLSLRTLQEVTALCKRAGIPTQIHCCGPSYSLVKMSAEETDLNSINPLESPPMGDVDLAQVKREFGHRLSLMGNLNTPELMLKGTPGEVRDAAKRAIDDAAAGGGFILSSGDQCGRDTPDANLFAMIEVARDHQYD